MGDLAGEWGHAQLLTKVSEVAYFVPIGGLEGA